MAARALTNDELKIITDNGDNAFLTKHPKRDKLLFFMGIKTGMKVVTMLEITVGDVHRGIDAVDHLVRLNTHSPSKSIRYKFDNELRYMIDDWVLEMRGKIDVKPNTPLFCNMVAGDLSAITTQQANNIVKQICSDNLHTSESDSFSSMILKRTFERLSKIEEAKMIVQHEVNDFKKEDLSPTRKYHNNVTITISYQNTHFEFSGMNSLMSLIKSPAITEEKAVVLSALIQLVSPDSYSVYKELQKAFRAVNNKLAEFNPHIKLLNNVHAEHTYMDQFDDENEYAEALDYANSPF